MRYITWKDLKKELEMTSGWEGHGPSDSKLGDLLEFSEELARSWRLVNKLAKAYQYSQRHPVKVKMAAFSQSDKPDDWGAYIQHLEEKLVKRKTHLARLEECRVFERETDGLLVDAIGDALATYGKRTNTESAQEILKEVLKTYEQRLGPRNTEDES